VNEENATALEPDNQILAATLDRRDQLTLELRRHLGGFVGADESSVRDLDALEAAAREDRRESAPDALDLGELRHAVRLVAPGRRAAQSRVSSTIGLGGGGSSTSS
jgi:hypothetical protein